MLIYDAVKYIFSKINVRYNIHIDFSVLATLLNCNRFRQNESITGYLFLISDDNYNISIRLTEGVGLSRFVNFPVFYGGVFKQADCSFITGNIQANIKTKIILCFYLMGMILLSLLVLLVLAIAILNPGKDSVMYVLPIVLIIIMYLINKDIKKIFRDYAKAVAAIEAFIEGLVNGKVQMVE